MKRFRSAAVTVAIVVADDELGCRINDREAVPIERAAPIAHALLEQPAVFNSHALRRTETSIMQYDRSYERRTLMLRAKAFTPHCQ